MRLLHVTPYFEGAWAYGGIPRVASLLTRSLAARGHEVVVATTDAGDGSSRLSERSAPSALDIRWFPNLSNQAAYHLQLFLPLGLRAYLDRCIADFDLVHIHACRNLPGVLAAAAARKAAVPYVVQPNGTAPRLERRRLAKRAFDATLGRGFLAGAAAIIAVSQAERRQLLGLGVDAGRIAVLGNPVDLAEHAQEVAGESFRERYQLPRAAPIVLFLGRMTPRKRLDVVVRAFAALGRDDARLVLAGNDGGALPGALRLARSLGVSSRLCLTGLLTGRERLEALSAADLVIYPGQDEVFGLVAAESLLRGTPVVVAGDSGCGELVASLGGGAVVAEGDVGGFRSAIAAALADPVTARLGARRAAVELRARFAPERIAAELDGLYREVLGSARQRREVKACRA